MTQATESPPASNPRELGAIADDTARSLRALAEHFTADAEATVVLNLSRAGLLDVMAAGELDGVIVDGRIYVIPEQLQVRVLDEIHHGAERALSARRQAHLALRAFLADRPVRALWGEAVGEHHPLVCARRGARFVHYGLQYHSVVMRVSWLTEYAMDPQVRQRHPEIASLPAGPALAKAVSELPGVAGVGWATALADQGEDAAKPHRLSGWVRLDSNVWPLQVPDGVARLVDTPRGVAW